MNKLLSLVASMLKIGCIGFGGGNALIPILEKEFVEEKKFLSSEEFNNYVVMANITPGALPVEMATCLGRHICGNAGMVLGPLSMALPGIFFTVILVSILSQFSGSLLHQVEYISVGIGAFIIFLLLDYNKRILVQFKLTSMKVKRILVIGLVFFLTCGKEIRNIIGVGGTPIFDISTVDILYLAIFFIFYCFAEFTMARGVIAVLVSAAYVLCTGKSKLMAVIYESITGSNGDVFTKYVLLGTRLLMVALAAYAITVSIRKLGKTKKIPVKKLVKEMGIWLVFLVLLSLPAFFTFKDAIPYVLKGMQSTIISFGGGEAYLTVAESLFLSEEALSDSQLYGQLLPVVNALPGSILCKMLSGIGYYLGLNATGSMAVGYFTAIAGIAASVTASSAVVVFLIYFYEKFEELQMFVMLKKCIRPIVGGLLLSTASSLLFSCMKISLSHGWSKLQFLLTVLVMVILAILAKWKTKLPDIVLILIFGVITLGIFHIF